MQEYSTPSESEISHEHIPTIEEVLEQLKEVISDGYRIDRQRSDEKGVYLVEVIVQGENDGEFAEYGYMRKGKYPEGEASSTEITVTYYENNEPYTGKTFSSYVNGEWVKA